MTKPCPGSDRAARLARIAGLSLALCATAAPAQEAPLLRGPQLGADVNLSQGFSKALLLEAHDLGVDDFRAGLTWRRAEPREGSYDFTDDRVGYPLEIAALGARASVTLNWGNPAYDDGDTPHSPKGIAAFGHFAATIAKRFPAVDRLEIGNEINSVNFVRGPLQKMSPQERAQAYVPLLQSAFEAAHAARADIRILGGATHSIPAGYLWTMLDAGAAGFMDALAIHPYTTEPEQLVRQLAVLRRHPAAADLPVEVTEFASMQPATAAGYFLRDYCQMALAGISRAVWYPLNARGDGRVPLIQRDGRITDVGHAWAFAKTHLSGRPVKDAAQDAFTYGCRFGDDLLILWGEPRDITVAPGVEVLDATGASLGETAIRLSRTQPRIFRSAQGRIAGAVTLGPQRLIADSFDQFSYPEADELQVRGDAFERYLLDGTRQLALRTFPGQERAGAPWFPYRSHRYHRTARLTPDTLVPGGRDDQPRPIVHRWRAPQAMSIQLDAYFEPSKRSKDGISVEVLQNGTRVFSAISQVRIGLNETLHDLQKGDTVEFRVGPNLSSKGDLTGYRIRILHPQ